MTTSESNKDDALTKETVRLPSLDVAIVEELTHRRTTETTKLTHEISEEKETGRQEREEKLKDAYHKRIKDYFVFGLGILVVLTALGMSVWLLFQQDKDTREAGSKILLTICGALLGYLIGRKAN